MAEREFDPTNAPTTNVNPSARAGRVIGKREIITCDVDVGPYSFLSKAISSHEAEITGNPNPPLRFPLPAGSDFQAVADGLKGLHPQVVVEINRADGVLTVILPPSIKVGTEPVGLAQVAFVLRCQRDLEQLNFLDSWEACCGNGGHGCCSNA